MRRTPAVLTLLVIALAAGGGWWWKSKGSSAPAEGDAAAAASAPVSGAARGGGMQTVGVISALRQDVPVMVEASGTVAALNTVDLRAQTTSTVREVLIKDGQHVTRGQLLFRFDDRTDRANLEKARAQAARSRASLADFERQYRRSQELREQNFIAQNAVDTALTNLEAQRAQLLADEAAVQAAQVSLSYNELRAPLTGRAGQVNVVAGSLVQATATANPLVSIAQLNPINVSFSLPESELAPVLQAAKGGALEARVQLPGAPRGTPPLKGRLSFVDNLVDTTTGTIKVKAQFDNASESLWPGQYVRVQMVLRSLKDAVVIPQAAIIQRGNERSVYVVDAEKKAQLKTIQIAYPFGELAAVDGIKAGDKVVLDGKQNLRPGTAVREQPAAVNPAASARRASAPASGASQP